MREKLKQKKGFTIIELMAVIVIIAIIATLVVTSVISYREKAKEEYISALKDQLELAARSYYSDNPKSLPRGQIEDGYKIYNSYVMVSNLMVNNYFTNNLVDDEGNDCSSESYVTVSNLAGNYNYEPCLICNGRVLNEGGYCSIDGNIAVNEAPYCTFVEMDYEHEDFDFVRKLVLYTNSDITPEVLSNNININVIGQENTYVIYKPGTYTFKISKNGVEKECKYTSFGLEDTTSPGCVITKEESNTTYSYTVTGSDRGGVCRIQNLTTDRDVYVSNFDYTIPPETIVKHIETGDKTTDEQKFTYKIVDCSGKESTCDVIIGKKTTSSEVPEGGSEDCFGSDCNPNEPEKEQCNYCTPYEEYGHNYKMCYYYKCSSDGCSSQKYYMTGCDDEQENSSGTSCEDPGVVYDPNTGKCCNGVGYPGKSSDECDGAVPYIYMVDENCRVKYDYSSATHECTPNTGGSTDCIPKPSSGCPNGYFATGSSCCPNY